MTTPTSTKRTTRPDRRDGKREATFNGRRRYPRFFLDVDWFVESQGCSTLGRGLEISVRGAMLPLFCQAPIPPDVTLYVALPARARMFKARCLANMRTGKGWVLAFTEVGPEDLQLLGSTLIGEFGLLALPNLERKHARFLNLDARHFRELAAR